jgi:hypothetical protein
MTAVAHELAARAGPGGKTMTLAMRCRTLKQIVEAHPWLSMGALRRLLLHRRTNGFGRCVIELPGRLLIDEEEFNLWLGEFRCEEVPRKNAPKLLQHDRAR